MKYLVISVGAGFAANGLDGSRWRLLVLANEIERPVIPVGDFYVVVHLVRFHLEIHDVVTAGWISTMIELHHVAIRAVGEGNVKQVILQNIFEKLLK